MAHPNNPREMAEGRCVMPNSASTLEELLRHELREAYSAESNLTKVLYKLSHSATFPELRECLAGLLEDTKGHLERLKQIGGIIGWKLPGQKCTAMAGLVEAAVGMIGDTIAGGVRDAGLIGAMRRIAHFQMAGYGAAHAIAEKLGHVDVAKILENTLEEEEAVDARLAGLVPHVIGADSADACGSVASAEDVSRVTEATAPKA